MKTQAELLQGTNIPTDDLPGYVFTAQEAEFLAVAEDFAFFEWSKICKKVGLAATVDCIPENYENYLSREGRWSLD
ncbi:hypothetical protein BH10PAT3_BH10PAT3_5010 [soil metagenome]